jgi:hypothetical protein
MVSLALAFITFSNNEISTDQSLLFFSKTLFIAGLAHCLMGNVDGEKVKAIIEGIRLSGYPQDYGLILGGVADQERARMALVNLLSF